MLLRAVLHPAERATAERADEEGGAEERAEEERTEEESAGAGRGTSDAARSAAALARMLLLTCRSRAYILDRRAFLRVRERDTSRQTDAPRDLPRHT